VEAYEAGSLPSLQYSKSQELADRWYCQLLAKYKAMAQCTETQVQAEQHLASLLSVQAQCGYSMAQHHTQKGLVGEQQQRS
jgi:hypothetical protein